MAKIDDILARLKADRAELAKRLAELDQQISDFESIIGRVSPSTLELIFRDPEEVRAVLPEPVMSRIATPKDVVPLARDTLLAAGAPMKRGRLARALLERGVELAGVDKSKNLGTILWRHPRDFVTIEGMGYWVKGVPLGDIYIPERDDEPLPKSTVVKTRG